MDKKDYHSSEVQAILDKYVTREKYGDYKPILDEIIQRRKFEFGFSIGRIEQEIKNMVKNINKIRFFTEEEENLKLADDTAAIYDNENKEIILNGKIIDILEKNYIKRFNNSEVQSNGELNVEIIIGQKIFETLTHEVYHSINDLENGLVGIMWTENFGGECNFTLGKHLNEVITESAATRTTNNKCITNINQGYQNTNGYEFTTFISNMMAQAIGVSEKELLINGLGNYNELFDFFSSKFPEVSSSKVYNSLAILEGAAEIADKSFIQKGVNLPKTISEKFANLYENFFNLAVDQIRLDNRELSIEYIGEIFFRNQKMNYIMQNSCNMLLNYGVIDQEGVKKIEEKTHNVRKNLENQVLDLFEVCRLEVSEDSLAYQYAKKGELKEYVEYYDERGEFARYATLSNEDKMQELMYVAYSEKEFHNYISYVREDDFTNDVEWDSRYYVELYNIIEKHRNEQKISEGLLKVTDKSIPNLSMGVKLGIPENKDDDAR